MFLKDCVESVVKQTLDDIIDCVVQCEKEVDDLKIVINKKWLFRPDHMSPKINENACVTAMVCIIINNGFLLTFQ